MNRVPFDQLLRGVQDSRNPSENNRLAMFGESKDTKKIRELDETVKRISGEFEIYKRKAEEMGIDLGNVRKHMLDMKIDVGTKASTVTVNQIGQYCRNLHNRQDSLNQHVRAMTRVEGFQSDDIKWLKSSVRALSAHNPLPVYPLPSVNSKNAECLYDLPAESPSDE